MKYLLKTLINFNLAISAVHAGECDISIKMKKIIVIILSLILSNITFASDFICDGYTATQQEYEDAKIEITNISKKFYDPWAIGAVKIEENCDLRKFRNTEACTILLPLEQQIINSYTGFIYGPVNKELRAEPKIVSNISKALCSSISQLPRYEGKVYRVTNLPPEVAAKYKEGNTITELAFMSTSMSSKIRRNFYGGGYFFTIITKTGRDISMLSGMKKEKEVLIPAGARFYVTKVNDGEIFLREI